MKRLFSKIWRKVGPGKVGLTRFERALMGANDGIWEYQVQTGKTYYSPRWKGMLGYAEHELEDEFITWESLVHPADLAQAKTLLQQYLDGVRDDYEVEFRMRHRDGHWVDILSRGLLERDAQGRPKVISGTHVDISKLRDTEAALRDSHQRLEAIQQAIEEVGIGIHFVAADGQLLYVNDAACSLLGYSREELLQMGVPGIDPNMTAEQFAEISSALRGQTGHVETMQRHRDGSLIPVEVIFQHVAGNGPSDDYFIAFQIDLTERKQGEEERQRLQHQLLQAQKMESIGHLTGGIAHDFNNMLGVILGNAQLLQRNRELDTGEVEEKRGDYLAEIAAAAKRSKEMISQMLLFSRRHAAPLSDEIPLTRVASIINEVEVLLRSSLPSSIELYQQIETPDLLVRIEAVNLQQILLNLIINARDAIGGYGQIRVSLSRYHGHGDCDSCHQPFEGEYAALAVKDSGTGIAAEHLERIFDPFYTTKGVGEGSGMGLSVVHGLVHSLGGHVLLASEQGVGTTVTILLPLAVGVPVPPPSPTTVVEAEPSRLDGIRIMVVDDEPLLTRMLQDVLSLFGAEVTTYECSDAALQVFQAGPQAVDLVVTDETMPGMSGLDLARQMLGLRPSLPIILCTGYSENVNSETARETGLAALMFKPVDLEKLVEAIRRAVPAH